MSVSQPAKKKKKNPKKLLSRDYEVTGTRFEILDITWCLEITLY